jgi:hypothetical protein
MPLKTMKCCCPTCGDFCIGLGSLFEYCAVCSESPRYWNLTGVDRALDAFFTCCPELGFQPIQGFLFGETGGTCQWFGPIVYCPDGTTAQIILSVNGLDAGSNTVEVLFSDGRRIVWTNVNPWMCLCTNLVRRTFVDDVGDFSDCRIPTEMCVIPIAPCCPERTTALPRTLVAEVTSETNCPCVDGSTGDLTWDPALDAWIGTIPYCAADLKIKLRCWRDVLEVTDWNGTVQWINSTDPINCNNSSEVEFGIGIVGMLTIVQCDPVHLRFTITNTGGCCGTPGNSVTIDIVEV